MDGTKGVTMAEIEDAKTKGADKKTPKVEAAAIHEEQNLDQRVPDHIEGTSQTPKEISNEIKNPPKPNEDEVKGADLTEPVAPHSADPAADPEGRSSRKATEVKGEEGQTDRLKLKRVSGDEVYGNLGAPPSNEDALKIIRDREKAAGRGLSKKGSEVTQ